MSKKPLEIKFSPFVEGYCDVEDQLPEYLMRKAGDFFLKEKSEKLGITNREDFEKRRRRLQEYFLKAIGGLPKERTPLNSKVRGILEKENYRIEKIIYESLPKFYVTSLLYVPKKTKEKTPCVVKVCGHSRYAKASPYAQKVCIDLVKNGFTVLVLDPLGQGERLQYWDPKSKNEIVRWGTRTHSYVGLQCSLIGDSVARYFIWDAIRGIDYLTSRKEVDEERIGVTGCSGGGTQTSYLMMLEPRIKAAVPVCFITSIETVMKNIGPQDAEQNIFGAVKVGINHDDYVTALAPKPVLIGAAAYDFFPIEGVLQTFERAKKIYRLYDAEENIALHIGKHTHGYSDEIREAAVNWFKVHLKNEKPDFKTTEISVEPEESLNVTNSGQIIGEIPDAKTVFDMNLERLNEKKAKRTTIENEADLSRYITRIRTELETLLNIPEAKDPIYPRIIRKQPLDSDGLQAEKIFFFSEPGITVTAIMIYEDGAKKAPLILALFENGTNDISKESETIRKMVSEGKKVLVFDVRGIGGVKSRKVNPYGTEFELVYDAYLLGASLVGMRTFDVLRGIDYLRSREDVDFEQLGLYARAQAATYGFFASVLNPEVKNITLEDMLYSYENLVRTRIYDQRAALTEADNASSLESMLVNGILEHFDIVDLLPSLYSRNYKFINLMNAEHKKVTTKDLEEGWLKPIKRYYPILGNVQKNIILKN